MPANDSDPDNYSIDDMMDRLRTRGEGSRDGERTLVTREDGSQVYKMRKRKRRSHQPKKEKEVRDRKMRVFQVVSAVALVAVTGLVALGAFVYLNTSAYQQRILAQARTWTGVKELKVTQMRLTPVSAGAGAVELIWPEEFPLKSLKLNAVRADLQVGPLASGKWHGTEMVGGNGGLLVVRSLSSAGPLMPEREGDCPFHFRYRCPQLKVIFGSEEAPAAVINGTEATYDLLDPAATTGNLRFEGGQFTAKGWGDFDLKLASFQVETGGLRVGAIRLSPKVKSDLAVIEILNPAQASLDLTGEQNRFAVRLSRMPLHAMMGQQFSAWIEAEIETPDGAEDGSISFTNADPSAITCRIPFRGTSSSETALEKLPLCGVLAKELGDAWYQRPVFDLETAGTLIRDSGRVGIENLNFAARFRLAMKGSFFINTQGVLTGTLEMGLPDGVVNEGSAAFRTVFGRRSGGYSWASVRISGTGRQPLDDLQAQLDGAATGAPTESGGTDPLEDAFRELTTPDGR